MEQQNVNPQKPSIPQVAVEAILQPQTGNGAVSAVSKGEESKIPEPEELPIQDPVTVRLAARDVRTVLDKQKEERQILLTQMNILFVTNTAVLTVLAISRLLTIFTIFNAIEVVLVLLNFILLINALLPRRVVITPVPNDDFLERYLALSNQNYELQMLVNLVEAYNANKQTIDDISQTLTYAAYVTLGVIFFAVLHLGTVYFIPELKSP